jgi:nicotinamidase-related amidase
MPARPGFGEFGVDMGPISTGRWAAKLGKDSIPGGRTLVKDSYNARFHPMLARCVAPGDIPWDKNRPSGFCPKRSGQPLEAILRALGITTLLFSGIHTDDAVAATMEDAVQLGFDCLMLKDLCHTYRGHVLQGHVAYEVQRKWGFVLTAQDFLNGVDHMGRVDEGVALDTNIVEESAEGEPEDPAPSQNDHGWSFSM